MMQPFVCPDCRALRPEDYHLDWCQYTGPDFGDEDIRCEHGILGECEQCWDEQQTADSQATDDDA